ncbi:hypothetical protein [Longimicrobium sp.]|uniref:hypothetical protein n=1 Tax=Longimicrobium sp. TaxID=2029185 RepID=UPI003B3B326F
MRTLPGLASLLCLLSACGNDAAEADKSAASATPRQVTYAECMAAADRQPSRAETVARAAECMRLPDAPPPGSTLPPGTPPPPVGAFADADTGAISSVYTSLSEEDCRMTSMDEESGSSSSRCPGTAGYALNAHDGDARISIDVVAPDGKVHELNYWGVITHNFSSPGPRAEWRMRGGRPIALIVRVNASEDPVDSSRLTSYLAVAKITPRQACVTDRIAPSPTANEQARAAADRSAGRPCLTEVPQG